MAIVNGYATLADLKARLGIGVSDVTDDSVLENVVEAVSRWIDHYCNRRFYSAAETRYYTAESPVVLWTDDLVSITSLATDDDGDRVYETAWAATDYDLEPYNAALSGEPYTAIRIAPNGSYTFPSTRKGVKITGTFGYPAIPDAVAEACLLQSSRVFRRKDAPLGVVGSPEIGQAVTLGRVDPDVRALLQGYVKLTLGAI